MHIPNPFAVFRADASTQIGGGHVMRCLTLADEFARNNLSCAFVCNKEALNIIKILSDSPHEVLILESSDEFSTLSNRWPQGCDLFVIDHYGKSKNYEGDYRTWANQILVIDDLADRKHDCDYLLDQTLGRQKSDYEKLTPEKCRMFLGANFALLRPQFKELREKTLERRSFFRGIERILVSMGASDPLNISSFVLKGIDQSNLNVKIDLIINENSPHSEALRKTVKEISQDVIIHTNVEDMASIMSAADLAIGAGGTTSWERCCLGLPSLIIITADNQRFIAKELERAGAAINIGDWKSINSKIISTSLQQISEKNGHMEAMSLNSARICDGTGAIRIAECLAA